MICRCPKCGKFTNVNACRYASSEMERSYERTASIGAKETESVKKWCQKKLGDNIGGTIGDTVKFARKTIVEPLAHTKSIVDGLLAYGNFNDDDYNFKCESCNHTWVVKKEDAKDCTDEFYEECYHKFLEAKGRRYLVVDPNAIGAYNNATNVFLLRKVPEGIEFPDNTVNFGEIYVSHPAIPTKFYSLEKSSMKILEDEMNDMTVFFGALGAREVSITIEEILDKEKYDKTSKSGKVKAGHKVVSAEIAAMRKREMQEYQRLKKKFRSKIKCEFRNDPIADENDALYKKWHTMNPEWGRILELRKNGTTYYDFSIESEQSSYEKRKELDKVEATYSEIALSASAKVDYEVIRQIKESKRIGFKIEVSFHPLSKYANLEIENIQIALPPQEKDNAMEPNKGKIGRWIRVILVAILLGLCAGYLFYAFGLH